MDRLMHATLAELMPSLDGAQLTGDAVFDGVSTDSRSAPSRLALRRLARREFRRP